MFAGFSRLPVSSTKLMGKDEPLDERVGVRSSVSTDNFTTEGREDKPFHHSALHFLISARPALRRSQRPVVDVPDPEVVA